MIIEIVSCDYKYCDVNMPLNGGMVPSEWVQHDGRHYCGATHFNLADPTGSDPWLTVGDV